MPTPPEQEIKLKLRGILGVSAPFYQGGSMRLTIPKRAVEKYRLDDKIGKDYFSLIFLETDNGMLLLPLEKLVSLDNIKEALKFVDIATLSKEDIELLHSGEA